MTSQDMDGNTPLMLSAMSKAAGATECMRSLIGARNKYFDLDARNLPHSGGYTALHLAAIGKYFQDLKRYFLQPTTYIISVKKPNRVKLLISCGADIGVKNSEGLSALYFINKNVPECMKNFEQRLDTGVSLSQSRDERRIELSTNLREVSQS